MHVSTILGPYAMILFVLNLIYFLAYPNSFGTKRLCWD
uniref:Uncharacterized protein n=1 Tax=Arundo donax TaxID=35708 RepID=A0A0A9C8U5_ARUDO